MGGVWKFLIIAIYVQMVGEMMLWETPGRIGTTLPPQDLNPCLTLSVFLLLPLASTQKQTQNAIVGSWKHFHALLYCWKQLRKVERKLLLGACWWSFLKQEGLSITQSSSSKWPLDTSVGRAEVSPAYLKIYESLDHDLKKKVNRKLLLHKQDHFD